MGPFGSLCARCYANFSARRLFLPDVAAMCSNGEQNTRHWIERAKEKGEKEEREIGVFVE